VGIGVLGGRQFEISEFQISDGRRNAEAKATAKAKAQARV
jgi:hypothetical protein